MLFVLLTLLTFATPQVSWSSHELRPALYSSLSIAAPSAGAQLARAGGKTDKTFGLAAALRTECVAIVPPPGSFKCESLAAFDARDLDLGGLPLAPRPPPTLS
jgi:hypothetical protein